MLNGLLSILGFGRPATPDHVVWLCDSLLLVGCRAAGAGGEEVEAEVEWEGEVSSVPAHTLTPEGKDGWQLLVLELPGDDGDMKVGVRCGRRRLAFDGVALAAAPRRTEALAEGLVELDLAERSRVLDFIRGACADHLGGADGPTLAGNLRTLRNALRRQLPTLAVSGEEGIGVNVDSVLGVDESSFWIKGWVSDPKRAVTSITAVSPEGTPVDLLAGAFRHQRRDVQELYAGAGQEGNERHGLVNYVRLDAPSRIANGWFVQLRAENGTGVEVAMPDAVRSSTDVRHAILADTDIDPPRSFELMRNHAHPALTRLQERIGSGVEIDNVIQYGTPPPSPAVSLIVPLYGRIDFVQHQFAQFAHDRELWASDLIYVLDQPELAIGLHRHAAELHELYDFPFRVAVLNRHAGFAGANNLAVSIARGRLVLFANSDVFPDRPGWIGRMAAFYDATPDIGALGPKLLYEDDSLQHAGLLFERDGESGLWGNQHFHKGFSRDFPAANVARPVPAVTAACTMIDRGRYEEVGGLSTAYVTGGYEDSDLCLRLIEAGRRNWYLPQVELYHLEDQSFPTEQRELVTRYNMWLQTHLWDGLIERLMREEGAREPQAPLLPTPA